MHRMNLCIAALMLALPTSGAFTASNCHNAASRNIRRQPIGSTRKTMTSSDDTSDNQNGNEMRAMMDRRKALLAAGGIVSSLPFLSYNGIDDNNNNILLGIPPASASEAAPKEFPCFTLANDVKFPILALNTAGLSKEDSYRSCTLAAKYGFTHFDFHPGAQRDGVAQFLKQNGNRDKFFLNTKIRKPPVGTTPSDAAQMCRDQIDEDLKALNVDRVDMLMLRDSPDCEVMRAQWKVLEEAVAAGKTRSVGVVNYCEESLRCILKTAKVKPAVNYYYSHVGMTATGRGYKLRDFCDRKKIKTFAYGPYGEPGPSEELLNNKLFKSIGDASNNVYNYNNHGQTSRTPEEIALRWLIQSGAAASVRPSLNYGLGTGVCKDDGSCDMGLKQRAAVFDWSLTGEEMNKLTYIIKSEENPTLFSSSGCPDAFVMPK